MSISRRKALGAIGGIFGIGGAIREGLNVNESIKERTESVAEIASFLSKKNKEGELFCFERELSKEDLVTIFKRLSRPPLPSETATEELMDSYGNMLKVEDDFAGKLNTAPHLEKRDLELEGLTGKNLPIATSFGLGQIKPETALRLARSVDQRALATIFPDLFGNLEKVKNQKLTDAEIVDLLDLQGNGSVIFGFLAFQECYNIYGRAGVDGPVLYPETRGVLHYDRGVDGRAYSLAVAGYSATPLSPMVAKAQTFLNEMLLSDPELLKKAGGSLLSVDGDLGKQTVNALRIVSENKGIEISDDFLKEGMAKKIPDLDQWIIWAYGHWQESLDSIVDEAEVENLEKLKTIFANRYSCINMGRGLLIKMVFQGQEGEAQKKIIQEAYDAFMLERDFRFLDLIFDQKKFNDLFPGYDYPSFILEIKKIIKNTSTFDNRFRGYVPMAFAPGKFLGLSDPKNVAGRVALGHKVDDFNPQTHTLGRKK